MTKQEADDLKKISIFWLKKEKLLRSGCWYNTGIQWTNGWSEHKSNISIQISLLSGDQSMRLMYTQTDDNGEKKDYDYQVPIVSAPCRYGGVRYWFTCPLSVNGKYCGRRVAVLYKGNGYFGCRHCYNLTYESRNKNRYGKHFPTLATLEANFKADKLRETMKRRWYGGKPTKKQRRIDAIYNRAIPYMRKMRDLYA